MMRSVAQTSRAIGTPGQRPVRSLDCSATPLVFLLGLIAPLGIAAQTSYGTILGTVTDESGAAVAGASIILTNEGTGRGQGAATGETGAYSLVNLNPGYYTIALSEPGFESVARSHVDVQIGGFTRVDVVLRIGDVKQTFTVTSGTPDLHTDSATLDGVIEGQQVLEAPLNGRNVNNL